MELSTKSPSISKEVEESDAGSASTSNVLRNEFRYPGQESDEESVDNWVTEGTEEEFQQKVKELVAAINKKVLDKIKALKLERDQALSQVSILGMQLIEKNVEVERLIKDKDELVTTRDSYKALNEELAKQKLELKENLDEKTKYISYLRDLHISVNDKNAKLVSAIANTKKSLENLEQCQAAFNTSSQPIWGVYQQPREINSARKNISEVAKNNGQELEPCPSRRCERVPSDNEEGAKQKKANSSVSKRKGKKHRFICTVCGAPYRRQHCLIKHMKLKHQQEECSETEDEELNESVKVNTEGPPSKKNCQAEDVRESFVLLEKLPNTLDQVEQEEEDELLDI